MKAISHFCCTGGLQNVASHLTIANPSFEPAGFASFFANDSQGFTPERPDSFPELNKCTPGEWCSVNSAYWKPMREFDTHIKETARDRILDLEKTLDADVALFFGPIFPSVEKRFRDFIEDLRDTQSGETARNRIAIVLSTPGGSAETVEKLVEIIRYHYSDVTFVIPDEAMSAGTIFAMSGDAIYMDYTSSLGPIDPQVNNGNGWVPALGYLDQVEKMIEKSKNGSLSDAELVILQNLDLAMLSRYEQAKNLTITLLKKWLVEYKFKDWAVHRSNAEKLGKPVTDEEKQERAQDIAKLLADNKIWHSHGRKIGVRTVQNLLRLEIVDYSSDKELRGKILAYTEFITDYINRHEIPFFLHHRRYF